MKRDAAAESGEVGNANQKIAESRAGAPPTGEVDVQKIWSLSVKRPI